MKKMNLWVVLKAACISPGLIENLVNDWAAFIRGHFEVKLDLIANKYKPCFTYPYKVFEGFGSFCKTRAYTKFSERLDGFIFQGAYTRGTNSLIHPKRFI